MQKKLNDALMGILRVRNLISPPYISTEPSLSVHKISKSDHFVIVGSDGLFDFFSNEEAVKLVHSYILSNPTGDPAKFLLEQLVARAAACAGKFNDMTYNQAFILFSFHQIQNILRLFFHQILTKCSKVLLSCFQLPIHYNKCNLNTDMLAGAPKFLQMRLACTGICRDEKCAG